MFAVTFFMKEKHVIHCWLKLLTATSSHLVKNEPLPCHICCAFLLSDAGIMSCLNYGTVFVEKKNNDQNIRLKPQQMTAVIGSGSTNKGYRLLLSGEACFTGHLWNRPSETVKTWEEKSKSCKFPGGWLTDHVCPRHLGQLSAETTAWTSDMTQFVFFFT